MSEEQNEAAQTESTEEDSSIKIEIDRSKYVDTKSASGKKSLRRDDAVARAMDGLPIDAVHALGKKLLKEDTAERYGHLNVGMQRMNVGNRLRKWVAHAEEGEDREAFLALVAQPHLDRAVKAAEKAAKAAAKESDAKAAEKAKITKAKEDAKVAKAKKTAEAKAAKAKEASAKAK